jgi:hypothetical protein
MKIDKALYYFYEEKINEVQTPVFDIPFELKARTRTGLWPKAAAAAILVLLSIPFIYRIQTPSILAEKAAVYCEDNELNTRIQGGLLEFQKIILNSSLSGGKK